MNEHNKTILVIDDSKEFRTIYCDRLLSEGFVVIDAANGEEGYKILQEKHVDLVILDIAMPKVDGPELLALIRGNPLLARIPVIILTVFDERVLLYSKVMEAGASGYLVKGKTSPGEVVGEIRKLLGVASVGRAS